MVCFLLESLTPIFCLFLFIYLSVWIAKSQRIVDTSAYGIRSGWSLYAFSDFSFPKYLNILL